MVDTIKTPNIIFIMLDGFRRDRLSLCKNLSNFADESCFFANNITGAPYTIASMHSLFSSLYPSKNGVDGYNQILRFKKDKIKTITQYLRDAEYTTTIDLIQNVLPEQGFDVHYDKKYYFESGETDDIAERHRKVINETNEAKKPFFLNLHYVNVHDGMVKNVAKKYTDFDEEYFSDYKRNEERYNSYILEADEYIGKIFNKINDLGLFENTIVAVFSDHGTSNGEKIGEKMYGSFVYDYTVRTVLLLKIPGETPKKILTQTRSIDLMPTILDILCIEQNNSCMKIQGKSLLPLIKGEETEDRIAFSETGGLNGPWPSPNKHNVFGIKYKNKKIIFNKTPKTWEFYDLESDPDEKHNIINSGMKEIEEMKTLLRRQMIKNKDLFRK